MHGSHAYGRAGRVLQETRGGQRAVHSSTPASLAGPTQLGQYGDGSTLTECPPALGCGLAERPAGHQRGSAMDAPHRLPWRLQIWALAFAACQEGRHGGCDCCAPRTRHAAGLGGGGGGLGAPKQGHGLLGQHPQRPTLDARCLGVALEWRELPAAWVGEPQGGADGCHWTSSAAAATHGGLNEPGVLLWCCSPCPPAWRRRPRS